MSAILLDNKCSDGKEHKKFKRIFFKHSYGSSYGVYKCSFCEFTLELKTRDIKLKDIPTEFPNMAALLTYQQKIS